MAKPGARFQIEYDPRLVESAMLLRIAGDREERRFYRGRDLIYELRNAEKREERFREFHGEWFIRLGLGRPIQEALTEQAGVASQVQRCCVACAPSARDEGADLHELRESGSGDSPASKALLIQLKPERLLEAAALQPWLRRELMHIADMLDPRFGYERFVPSCEAGPAYANLLKDRYRVLWNTWIDSRLLRRGWLPKEVRQQRWEEFAATFPALGGLAEAKFQEIFDAEFQTHHNLMAFALHPGDQAGIAEGKIPGPQTCPLCRFPVYQLLSGSSELPEGIQQQIRSDFPSWLPQHGLCLQCADLYRAREMSRAAEAALPGIRTAC